MLQKRMNQYVYHFVSFQYIYLLIFIWVLCLRIKVLLLLQVKFTGWVNYLIPSESCYPNQEFGWVCAVGTLNPLAHYYRVKPVKSWHSWDQSNGIWVPCEGILEGISHHWLQTYPYPASFIVLSLGVLPGSRLMVMCHWMGLHFHDGNDYYGIAFL